MKFLTPELKKIAGEVVGPKASGQLMKRILAILDESASPSEAALKVEKLVALFLSAELAKILGQRFALALRA